MENGGAENEAQGLCPCTPPETLLKKGFGTS